MSVTTRDYLALSEVVYENVAVIQRADSISAAVADTTKLGAFRDVSQNILKRFTGGINRWNGQGYDKTLGDWKVVDAMDDNASSGFYGAAFRNIHTGELVLSFRGTEPNPANGQLVKDLVVTDITKLPRGDSVGYGVRLKKLRKIEGH